MTTCLHKVRDYSHQEKGGVTVDMSQTRPGSRLFFLWRGCQFKRVVVTVDVIPAIEIAGWPNSAIRPPQLESDRYHVIPKVSPSIQNSPNAGLYWRISTSIAEERIFSAQWIALLAPVIQYAKLSCNAQIHTCCFLKTCALQARNYDYCCSLFIVYACMTTSSTRT